MREVDDADRLREDEDARTRALDVACSFLVQAPAGSGKTELLIQRFLALLAHVDAPERILALTFTRKAAGEMRERVLAALAAAAAETPVDPAKPQERVTRELANAAIAQDERCGWALAVHPARLRILTFDAVSTWLVRSAPFAAGLGPAPAYAEDASGLHAEAAVATIAAAAGDDPHWQRLLAHMHNDADQVARLLARLLAKRDQLLRQIGVGNAAAVREALHVALDAEVDAALGALRHAFPDDLGPEIARLAAFASRELAADPAQSVFARALGDCAACGGVPDGAIERLPLWRTLAEWMLTKQGEPRAAVNKGQGFPAPGKDATKAGAKQAMLDVLGRLRDLPGLAASLHGVARMPTAASLAPQSWAVVEALLAIVPRAAAELTVVFARRGEVDFTQAGLAALSALGEPEAPTDLLQRLDYRLAHVLVDEFQDTSTTQLELVKRLTAGWTPGEDGRTIFAVGDPMQSIYRFREAEVRLFVEAQLAGSIAGLPVECLTLRRNFRSQRSLVEWVNEVFPAVLGRVNDPVRSAVAFEAAVAAKPALPDEGVSVEIVADAGAEARAVTARVRAAQAAGSRDVAILVRARSHLVEILPALRAAGIAFTAIELDTLGQRQAVQDLVSLTHALLQPGDRLAWLAVLRAPWCGLTLADLHAIAGAATAPRPVAAALADPSLQDALSSAGRARLDTTRAILDASLAAHGRAGVAARVRNAWLALGGPACLADALDLETARRFFDVLSAHEQAGDVPDWGAFLAALDALHASPPPAEASGVQLMTMHKAKGLQFDTVIVPGLGARGRGASQELLRWRSRDRGLLIAPANSPGSDPDPLYDYLKRLEDEEASAELGRLLYVACTRAQARLHLIAALGVREDKSGELAWRLPKSSSLARLWPGVGGAIAPPGEAPPARPSPEASAPPLVRLPAGYAPPPGDDGLSVPATPPAAAVAPLPFDWAQERARLVGTLAHRLLARIGSTGAGREDLVAALAPRVRAELASAGLGSDEIDAAAVQVLDAIRRTLADPRGRWLFDATHDDARSEWGLAGVDEGMVVHVVLDRTFVADGVRWIVDFKTGTHGGGDVDGFLANEVQRYRGQLQRYGRLMRALDTRPLRLALYYPLVDGGFREVPADGT